MVRVAGDFSGKVSPEEAFWNWKHTDLSVNHPKRKEKKGKNLELEIYFAIDEQSCLYLWG